MNLFDEFGKITKFPNPEAMLEVFFPLRLDFYVKRKELLLKVLRREQSMLANKARFVEEVCEGELIVSNRKRKDILEDLKSRGYELFFKEENQNTDEDNDGSEENAVAESKSDAELAKGYEYLLGMKIWSLTFEKAEQLREQLAVKTQEVAELEATPSSQIWKNDLLAIEAALDERDVEMEAAEAAEIDAQNKNSRRQVKKGKTAKKGKTTATAAKKLNNKKKKENS
uniref:DNA topoisomerase (ATP-hydrolyzing) n=1 Tax=Eucampia antarctica TaxID=49252 RepID=A0A7S2S1P6_9STRA|mmetsp:Transcript_2977/g.2870  ORF Transcript_2977/g.2870 Transcript_2977/m.2870 type:complete len:227 (+) Transcript_2977:2-682(+)